MDRSSRARLDLILLLALSALARPLLGISGVYDRTGPGGSLLDPIFITGALAALWVGVVVATRAPKPLLTLAAAGALYGLLAILLQQLMWSPAPGGAPANAPGAAPIPIVSWLAILVTNTLWGGLLGAVAAGVSHLLPRRRAEA